MDDRRPACIIISAGKGDHRAARGLIGRSLRQVLGIKRWYDPPHHVVYYRNGFDGEDDFAARYCLNMTDAEYTAWEKKIISMARKEGWSRPPTDAYHD